MSSVLTLIKALSLTAQNPAGQAGLGDIILPAIPAGGAVLTVGAGKEFATLGAALQAAQDGATILVNAGTYTNDFGHVTAKVTIIGVGGMANFVATIPPPNLKGILEVDNDVTIKNCSFSGVAIPDADGGNGAGIRYEGGRMVLENCAFSNNQNGILGGPVVSFLTTNTVTVDHCLFQDNGSGTGYTHNFYIGNVDKLTFTNNVSTGAVVGHELKSRALVNDIQNNVFLDGATGTASYSIDLPNGGQDTVANNIIEKGPLSENYAMVHFGGEGIPYAGSSLTVTGNQFVNDASASTVAVLNQTSVTATIADNVLTAIDGSRIAQGPVDETGNTNDQGVAYPDTTLAGVLPGNTLVFTDSAAHTVTMDGSVGAVQGGSGLLTVYATAGHVIVIGGTGGLNYTEGAQSGGNTIATVAGATDNIVLNGQDTLDSEGRDTITAGVGNVSAQIGGTATVHDGSGNNQWSVLGTATIIGQGASPSVAVAATGTATITGPVNYLHVTNNGGTFSVDIIQGGAHDSMSCTGGAVDVQTFATALNIKTAAGTSGATLNLGAGAANVTSLGSDTIHCRTGPDTVIVSGAANVYAGTGALSVFGRGDSAGAKVYGNGGSTLISGDTGNITYYGGALASTVQAQLSNITLLGGTGRLTVNGGSRETMTGGAGGLTYTATDGGGADTITTAAGSANWLSLAGADTINSFGHDVINGGSGNQVIAVHGQATINGSGGNSQITVSGNATLNGVGQDTVSVLAGGQLMATAGSLTNVTETGGMVQLKTLAATAGAVASSAMVFGGAAQISGGTGRGVSVTTAQGMSSTALLGTGTANVYSNGADRVFGGAGSATVRITAANTHLWGGAGTMNIIDQDYHAGDSEFVQGGAGQMNVSAADGTLNFTGGAGAATIDGGWAALNLVGGAGNLNVTGGEGGRLNFVAGHGTTTIAAPHSGATITFGAGDTNVTVAGWGAGDIFQFNAGATGGTDTITGFRAGVDSLVPGSGVHVLSVAQAGGSTELTLTGGSHLTMVGFTGSLWAFHQ